MYTFFVQGIVPWVKLGIVAEHLKCLAFARETGDV